MTKQMVKPRWMTWFCLWCLDLCFWNGSAKILLILFGVFAVKRRNLLLNLVWQLLIVYLTWDLYRLSTVNAELHYMVICSWKLVNNGEDGWESYLRSSYWTKETSFTICAWLKLLLLCYMNTCCTSRVMFCHALWSWSCLKLAGKIRQGNLMIVPLAPF